MTEVGRELQVLKLAHAEAMEVQKQGFQLEFEKVREKLGLVESRSETLDGELRLLKALKVTPAKSTSTAKIVPIVNQNKIEGDEGIRQAQDQRETSSSPVLANSGSKPRTEKRSYASVAISKPIQSPEKPWTPVNYGNRKSVEKQHRSTTKPNQLGRRVLFPRTFGRTEKIWSGFDVSSK